MKGNNMRETLIEAYNELMQIRVNGMDVEHMYRALSKLAEVINASENIVEEGEHLDGVEH